MISRTVTHLREAADAVKVAVADVSELLAAIGGLFGTATAAPVGSSESVEARQSVPRHLVNHVKRVAQREYRTHGLVNVVGVPAGVDATAKPTWLIREVWDEAEEAGAVEMIAGELVKLAGYAELLAVPVGGPVTDWLKRAWDWILEHQDELLAIALKFLQFLAMLMLI